MLRNVIWASAVNIFLSISQKENKDFLISRVSEMFNPYFRLQNRPFCPSSPCNPLIFVFDLLDPQSSNLFLESDSCLHNRLFVQASQRLFNILFDIQNAAYRIPAGNGENNEQWCFHQSWSVSFGLYKALAQPE